MAAPFHLGDIVDAMEMMLDKARSFGNRETGQVVTISLELISAAEEGEEELDLPKWQEAEWELAKRIVREDAWLRLPGKYDVNEWEFMRGFADSVRSRRLQEELLDAIHGRGAFRMFKSTIHRHRIEKDWYAFRNEALREIAEEWCEENEVKWVPGRSEFHPHAEES